MNVEDLVSEFYKRNKYTLTYGTPMDCTRGTEMWSNAEGEQLLPPVARRLPGRPTKNRKKDNDEPIKVKKGVAAKVTKEGKTTTCSRCGELGHNRRGCPKKPEGEDTFQKGTAAAQHGKKISAGIVCNEGAAINMPTTMTKKATKGKGKKKV